MVVSQQPGKPVDPSALVDVDALTAALRGVAADLGVEVSLLPLESDDL
jgi:hypothetical protein